jgi:antitoxin component YwqK of YwqJK toxin-antitoxin module
MRKIFFILSIVFLASCGPRLQEKTIETYPDGKPKRVQYFTPESEGSYLAKEIYFYENGQKKMEGSYNKEKQKHGKWLYWREDGKKWSEGYFFEGKDDGLRQTWHENGKKHYEGRYEKGTRVGVWKFYDETGKMVKDIDYDKEKE